MPDRWTSSSDCSMRFPPPKGVVNVAHHTPPSFSRVGQPLATNAVTRAGFQVDRLYEFEAPQYYDFTKQSDPERPLTDEHWFDCRKRTPSTPDFHFMAQTSSSAPRPKSTSGRLGRHAHFSGSNGGVSFMNTPIGRGQTFLIPSSVGADLHSSTSLRHRTALKRSATTSNVTGEHDRRSSDDHDAPATLLRSAHKRTRELGSDEKRIISGFLSTPLLVVRTPKAFPAATETHRGVPPSPLQKIVARVASRNAPEGLCVLEASLETRCFHSSIAPDCDDRTSDQIRGDNASLVAGFDIPNTATLPLASLKTFRSIALTSSVTLQAADSVIKDLAMKKTTAQREEYEAFQSAIRARARGEQERIAALASEHNKRLQRLNAGPDFMPAKSTKPLTVPVEFQLGSGERIQAKRRQPPMERHPPVHAVIRPAKQPEAVKSSFTVTVPHSPQFASKTRVKEHKRILTSEERELAHIQSLGRIHARPYDPSRLASRQNGKQASTKVTVPVAARLGSDDRIRKRHEREERIAAQDASVPPKIQAANLTAPIREKNAAAAKKTSTTVPQSPNISKPKLRPAVNLPIEQGKGTSEWKNQVTVPVTTALPGEELSRKKRERFEAQIRTEQKDLARRRLFHARPRPDFSAGKLTDNKLTTLPAPLTMPEPFRLPGDERSAAYREKQRERAEEALRREEAARLFKSRPVPASLHAPFHPAQSAKAPTMQTALPLQCERRAEERRAFDERVRIRQHEDETHKEALCRERETREIAELRRKLEYRAQPIRKFAPVHIAKSVKPPTVPVAPNLSTVSRNRPVKQ